MASGAFREEGARKEERGAAFKEKETMGEMNKEQTYTSHARRLSAKEIMGMLSGFKKEWSAKFVKGLLGALKKLLG